jgi:hypothetical protein
MNKMDNIYTKKLKKIMLSYKTVEKNLKTTISDLSLKILNISLSNVIESCDPGRTDNNMLQDSLMGLYSASSITEVFEGASQCICVVCTDRLSIKHFTFAPN